MLYKTNEWNHESDSLILDHPHFRVGGTFRMMIKGGK